MRSTTYADELTDPAVYSFPDDSEGRIERLQFKQGPAEGQMGYRFSWWRDNRIIPRPLDVTESEFIALMKSAVDGNVFSTKTIAALRKMLK